MGSPKEFPLIFSGSMVRANHAGIKRMTRRVVDLDRLWVVMRKDVRPDYPLNLLLEKHNILAPSGKKLKGVIHAAGAVSCRTPGGDILGLRPGEFNFVCPYAQGETVLATEGGKNTWTIIPNQSRVWVRETWHHILGDVIPDHRSNLAFRADYPDCVDAKWDRPLPDADSMKWVPSIHMPRWACRDVYAVTKVRIERLQAISPDDLVAEGIQEMTEALIAKYEGGWEPQHWLHSNGGPSYCRRCAEKALQESTAENDFIDGGYPGASIESDYLETCEGCGKMLETALISDDFSCYLPDEKGEYMEHPPCAEEVAMLASYNGGINEAAVNREVFRVFWDLLNGKKPGRAWADNPWVWVVEYDNPLWGQV